jgi:hypothetical protein
MKKLIKKAWDEFKNHFFIVILIDFVFLASIFFTFYFASRIIQNNVLLIYSLGEKVEEFNQLLADNIGSSALMEINSTLEIIKQASNYIILTTIISFVLFFALWCFFKGLIWKYSYDTKKHIFKGFLSYLYKFSLISLILFVVLVPLFVLFFEVIGSFVVSSGIYNFNLAGFLLFLLIFFIIFFLILYLFSVVFVMLNKYKTFEALKRGFLEGIKRPLMFLSFLGLWIIVFFILFIDKILYSFGRGFMIIDLILILMVFALYRFWFSGYFKKV